MNPPSDSPSGPNRHGKRPMIHPFSSSSSDSSSSSSSSSEKSRFAVPIAEEEDKSPECYVCARRFGTWKALFGHMRCHPEREWRGVRPLAVGEEGSRGRRKWRRRTTEESPATAGEYACGECARVFSTRQALGGHRASHRGVMGCSAKAKETTPATAVAPAVAPPSPAVADGGDGRRFACQVCGRQFVSFHGMRVHQRVHREGEGRREDRRFMVDLNLPPPPEVAEEEDEQLADEQGK